MNSSLCRRHALALTALFGLMGCGGGATAPVDPAQGEQAVRTAFECWKKGDTPESLHQRTPPMYLNEPEFAAGRRLLDFEIVEPLEPYGRQLRCAVKLSLEDTKTGAKTEKRIGYQVDTNPVVVIVREGL